MQNFSYKNNIYVLDGDLSIEKREYLYDIEHEKIVTFDDLELGMLYKYVERYDVMKGYKKIDSFESEIEAVQCIDYIRAQLCCNGQDSYVDRLTEKTNKPYECCCVPLK